LGFLHVGSIYDVATVSANLCLFFSTKNKMNVSHNEVEIKLKEQTIFIGHGRSKLWARLKIFLEDELKLNVVYYESESRVGESIIPVLEKMLSQATFAILILTAEDETKEGKNRARQNVVHEAGLFQGKLGFKKAIVLRQDGIEDLTNLDGLQYIGFSNENIEQTFYDLQRVLKREGIIT
jgi:predicted nucleotide-binding protein